MKIRRDKGTKRQKEVASDHMPVPFLAPFARGLRSVPQEGIPAPTSCSDRTVHGLRVVGRERIGLVPKRGSYIVSRETHITAAVANAFVSSRPTGMRRRASLASDEENEKESCSPAAFHPSRSPSLALRTSSCSMSAADEAAEERYHHPAENAVAPVPGQSLYAEESAGASDVRRLLAASLSASYPSVDFSFAACSLEYFSRNRSVAR